MWETKLTNILLFSLSDDNGLFYVEFVPQDVGTYIMDISILGQKIVELPIFYKVYDSRSVQIQYFAKCQTNETMQSCLIIF